MKKLSIVGLGLLLGLGAALGSPGVAVGQAGSAVVAPTYAGALVELRGDARQMGEQHAKLLDSQIQLLQKNYLNVYIGSGAKRLIALTAARVFKSYFPAEHLAEVDALAGQEGMDEREAVLAQCFLDLSPMTACSTITLPASASADHVARFARNLDFPALNIADKYSTVFIYHPEGRYQFVSIGWPGMVGVLSGMNEHGLCLANMEVSRGVRVPGAMPYTLLYRTVLEKCRTVGEAIELLEKTPRQTANNLMLMDAAGDRAVAEITPDAVTVRRAAADAPLISTNHQRGTDCDSAGRCKRFDYLHEQGGEEFGHIGVAELKDMLGHVSPGKATLQAMIFEPANRVMYLSTGADAAHGTFYKLDVGSRLR
jgi:isopenicillin-N N-acyltransferase-like protein